MNLNLQQKFAMLAGLSSALIIIVSAIAYYISSESLNETIEAETKEIIKAQTIELDKWLIGRSIVAERVADLLGNMGSFDKMKNPELYAVATSDKDVMEVTIGLEDKFFYGYNAGDFTGKIDPTGRGWYKTAKDNDKLSISDAYVDSFTNKVIVSAVAPIKSGGKFMGATCVDIDLATLDKQLDTMNYRGQGEGLIIERNGNILATSGADIKTVQELPEMAKRFDEMIANGNGYFILPADKSHPKKSVFVYNTLRSSGWIVGISVDESFVYGPLNSLRNTYFILVAIGAIVMFVISLKMSSSITDAIAKLQDHAVQLSKGNLRLDDIRIDSKDEIGTLATAFNDMSASLRSLIGKMSNTSHQVAAASEELTASAQQSADTSVHVAEKVGEVNMNVNTQLGDIDSAKESVEIVFRDIENMSEKTKVVTKASNETAESAQRGSKLMETAVNKMTNIEKSVMASAEVVKKLGESSQQIGQIVEAISGIAEQTNLLALNAAIEAARAGEHGRGFAVVSEEVRKLASESATSAEQIRDRINQIQHDTAQAVDAMQAGTKDVQEGTEAIREVGEQFKQIMNRVDGIQQQMAGIGTSMKTVSDGATRIVEAVESINEVSRQTAEHTNSISNDTETQSASNEEIAAASQSLSKLAEEMQNEINRFKI